MAESIMPFDKHGRCYLCNKSCPTEEHHIFGGGMRKLSEQYGLKVHLCHWCHNEPPYGVHFNEERNNILKASAQSRAMYLYGLTEDDFRKIFRKSYL